MTAPLRLGAFVVALAAAFGLAWAAGALVAPAGAGTTAAVATPDGAHADGAHADGGSADGGSADGGSADGADAPAAGGLLASQDGYTLELTQPVAASSGLTDLTFRITGPDGHPVSDYVREHDEELHLVVVRADLSTYEHLHPERDAAGTWSVPADLSLPGEYRVFADFVPAGHHGLVLGSSVSVPGDYRPVPLPAPATVAEVDGYTVSLDGELPVGEPGRLEFSVSRDGEPVRDLEPYLGAYGHLVALRAADQAYLHVHPEEPSGAAAGPTVAFAATAPSPGSYRLFLDFRHDGVVRTAELTVEVPR